MRFATYMIVNEYFLRFEICGLCIFLLFKLLLLALVKRLEMQTHFNEAVLQRLA